MSEGVSAEGRTPVELVVFDFDGTSIRGSSPAQLVLYLLRHRKLKFFTGVRIGLWALRYKFGLPQTESWVRTKVFSAFVGEPKEEVDAYLARFYDEVIAKRFRPAADAEMRRHVEAGRTVIVVSASWDAIVRRAMEFHPFQYEVSTRMVVDAHGNYTDQVDGVPVEGDEKVRAVHRFADERFGRGGWVLSYAYGDHHSDVPLLEESAHPSAVNPDNPLERTANKRGWPVLDWDA